MTAWYWHKYHQVDEWNRIESSEKESHIYGRLLLDKGNSD